MYLHKLTCAIRIKCLSHIHALLKLHAIVYVSTSMCIWKGGTQDTCPSRNFPKWKWGRHVICAPTEVSGTVRWYLWPSGRREILKISARKLVRLSANAVTLLPPLLSYNSGPCLPQFKILDTPLSTSFLYVNTCYSRSLWFYGSSDTNYTSINNLMVISQSINIIFVLSHKLMRISVLFLE